MMTKEKSSKVVNFMTPRAGVLLLGCGHTVKKEYSFSSSCLYWVSWIRQIKYMVMMVFLDSGAKVHMLGRACIYILSHYSEYALLYSITIQDINCHCRDVLLYYAIVDFYLFYDGADDMQI